MSAIAVIGAGGFVGAALLESFVLDGITARAIIRSHRSVAGFCQFGDAVDVRLADAERTDQVAAAIEGVGTVVNLTTGPPAGIVRSTRAIHEACTRAGVRTLIHLSSAVVYGDVLSPVDDDSPLPSKHWMPYARAKAASERWLRTQAAGALKTVVLRPGIVWGVRSLHTLGFIELLAGKRGYLVGGGAGVFNGIYIDNLVTAIRTVCDSPSPAPGFYNVGDRELVTWREFFDAFGPSVGCDVAQLPSISSDRFPWSKRAAFDAVQSLPLMNELYHWLKARAPDGVKIWAKGKLEGPYCYERHAELYGPAPTVDRELWHLQRVGYKLPIDKFERTFAPRNVVTLHEGVRRTLLWLQTLGLLTRDGSRAGRSVA